MMKTHEQREIEIERIERVKRENKRAAKNLQKSVKKNQRRRSITPSNHAYRTSIQNRAKNILKSKREKLTHLKKEILSKKTSEELKECTFKPKINKQSKKRKSRGVKALYDWKKSIQEKKFEKESAILKDITHKPKINKCNLFKAKEDNLVKVEDRLMKHIEAKKKKIEKKREEMLRGMFAPKITEFRDSRISNRSKGYLKSVSPRPRSSRGEEKANFNRKASRYFARKSKPLKKKRMKKRSKSVICTKPTLKLKRHASDETTYQQSKLPIFVKSSSSNEVKEKKKKKIEKRKRKGDKNVQLACNALKALDNLLKEKTGGLIGKDDDEFSRLEKKCEEECKGVQEVGKENKDGNYGGRRKGRKKKKKQRKEMKEEESNEEIEGIEEVLRKIEAKFYEKGLLVPKNC